MTAPRRIGAEDSATRAQLLDAAEVLMLEEGYAGVTSRRVAAKARLKPQLVHYYFRTMDDLFLAVLQRGADRARDRLTHALASPQPLRALWGLLTEPTGTRVVMELAAVANHRKGLRTELAEAAERFRQLQLDALRPTLERLHAEPEAALFLLSAASQILVQEEALGVSAGHAEVRALVDEVLERYEPSTKG